MCLFCNKCDQKRFIRLKNICFFCCKSENTNNNISIIKYECIIPFPYDISLCWHRQGAVKLDQIFFIWNVAQFHPLWRCVNRRIGHNWCVPHSCVHPTFALTSLVRFMLVFITKSGVQWSTISILVPYLFILTFLHPLPPSEAVTS